MPKKNPTEKDVGNRFNTKVPRMPNTKWTKPVTIEAIMSAVEPSAFFKFSTVEIHAKRRLCENVTFFRNMQCLDSLSIIFIISSLFCLDNTNVLSNIDNPKKKTRKIRVNPHARCIDDLGSSLQESNMRLRMPLAVASP